MLLTSPDVSQSLRQYPRNILHIRLQTLTAFLRPLALPARQLPLCCLLLSKDYGDYSPTMPFFETILSGSCDHPVSAYRQNKLSCRRHQSLNKLPLNIGHDLAQDSFFVNTHESYAHRSLPIAQTQQTLHFQHTCTQIIALRIILSHYIIKLWGSESLGPLSLTLSLSSNSLGECLLATQSQSLSIGATISLLPTLGDYAWSLTLENSLSLPSAASSS